jgi:hypothetical protein
MASRPKWRIKWWRPLGTGEGGWFYLDSDLSLLSDDGHVVILTTGARLWAERVAAIRRTPSARDNNLPAEVSLVTGAELRAGATFWILGVPEPSPDTTVSGDQIIRLSPLDTALGQAYLAAPEAEALAAFC